MKPRIDCALIFLLFTCGPVCVSAKPTDVQPPLVEGIEIFWALHDDDCPLQNEKTRRIEAGAYGVFDFDTRPFETCETATLGSERIRGYAHPGPAPHTVDCEALDGCATPLSALRDPWIAVIDWDNWHGRTVDKVIRSSMDVNVQTKIWALESTVLDSPAITDIDVLATLAELAALVDGGGMPAPRVINMSFGRVAIPDDASQANCNPERLSCQISRLLAHIARPEDNQPPRSFIVAAAGNHQKPLFPASLEHVISVGSLDMTLLAANDVVQAAWETPADGSFPRALMPGTGHCVSLATGGLPFETMAPAGSSFAAAMMSGWLMDAYLVAPNEVLGHLNDDGSRWMPRSMCGAAGGCSFRLDHGGVTFESQSGRAEDRMLDILNDDPVTCGLPRAGLISVATTVVPVPQSESPYGYPSVTELVATRFRPAPEPDPCVPCTLCCELLPSSTSPVAFMSTKVAAPLLALTDLEIDLHNGWHAPTGMTLKALYLRLPDTTLRLKLSKIDLQAFQDGKVGWLIIENAPLDHVDHQPTLIALLDFFDPMTGRTDRFWDATPLLSQ